MNEQDINDYIADLWQDILGEQLLTGSDNFFEDCGGDMAAAEEMISGVVEEYGVKIDMQTFLADPSMGAVVEYIQKQTA